MQYIYIDSEGNEVGPVNDIIIERGIRDGSIPKGTAIRSQLLKDFRTVESFDQFKAIFDEFVSEEEGESQPQKSGALHRLREASKPKARTTAYKAERTPQKAGMTRRILSACFDLALLGAIGIAIYIAVCYYIKDKSEIIGGKEVTTTESIEQIKQSSNKFILPEDPEEAEKLILSMLEKKKAESKDSIFALFRPWKITVEKGIIAQEISHNRFYIIDEDTYSSAVSFGFIMLFIIALFYYTLTLSIFAQTFGMWFWGIFLAKNDLEESYFLRTFIYVLLMLFFNILMIPFVLLLRRSPADFICGVQQIRVCSAP